MAQDTVIARDSSDEEEERGCKLPEVGDSWVPEGFGRVLFEGFRPGVGHQVEILF